MNREKDGRCILFAAGDFSDERVDVRKGDFVIACDAGLLHCMRRGIRPDLIVGDFDSLQERDPALLAQLDGMEREDPARIVRLQVRKDDTDSQHAMQEGLRRGYRRFLWYGALGGERLSHSFANCSLLLYLRRRGARGVIVDARESALVLENETMRFPKGCRGLFSLFPLGERAEGVTLSQVSFPLTDAVLTLGDTLGVSNEFLPEASAEITVKRGALLMLLESSEIIYGILQESML